MAFLADRGVPLAHGYVVRMAMPFGRGLGASAALSVALAKAAQPTEERGIFELAWALEHLFHGTSSGADVAGALAAHPLVYEAATPFQQPLPLAWSPVFYLTDSGTAVPTADAIATVARLRAQDPHLADGLDTQMKEATRGVIEALGREGGEAQLSDALHQVSDCFNQWGLVTPAMAALMTALRSAGAQAVKPTGAGLGGMVLSFWQTPPPLSFLDRLIPVEMMS
jgi:mevalonate kinase